MNSLIAISIIGYYCSHVACHYKIYTFKVEAQTVLFKDSVRTAQ
jgi:hypothetical protein